MNTDFESHSQHISQQYNAELDDVTSNLMAMGGLVEEQVRDAIQALVEADSAQAETVCATDRSINSMEVYIDEECARILARRQPAASDLRLVLVVSKVTRDLERIGDEAEKVARHALELGAQGVSPRGYVEIRHIGGQVSRMVHDALDAFARFDIGQALKVMRTDESVDLEYSSAMRELITFMMEDPRAITRVLNIIWSLRALERIGDHARNIAEHVIYLVKGKDVRHAGWQALEEQFGDGAPE